MYAVMEHHRDCSLHSDFSLKYYPFICAYRYVCIHMHMAGGWGDAEKSWCANLGECLQIFFVLFLIFCVVKTFLGKTEEKKV